MPNQSWPFSEVKCQFETNTFFNLDKYISIWTNTFGNFDRYIFKQQKEVKLKQEEGSRNAKSKLAIF